MIFDFKKIIQTREGQELSMRAAKLNKLGFYTWISRALAQPLRRAPHGLAQPLSAVGRTLNRDQAER